MSSFLKLTFLMSAALLYGCTNGTNGTNTKPTEPTEPGEEPPVVTPSGPELRPVNFSPNDVTILFPAPNNGTELRDNVIRLTDFRSGRVFTASQFNNTMALVTGDAGEIPGTGVSIRFPSDNNRSDWVVAGIRIDPGAPGLSGEMFDVFGRSPQIRLILQPVKQNGSIINVTDGSLHLVYAFHGPKVGNSCQLHNTPDVDAFEPAVNDLLAIKQQFNPGSARPLGIHPAFPANGRAFRDAIKDYLETHLDPDRLFAVSIAAIPENAPEPWVFVAMQQVPGSNRIVPVPSPAVAQPGAPVFGQMINFAGGRRIQPSPATRNLLPVDCNINLPGQVPSQQAGAGVSTATAFDDGDQDITGISRIIADPSRAHFFNTDCASCHTETRKEIDMNRATAGSIGASAGIDPNVLPKEQWNVRAMGWFPGFRNRVSSGAHETMTRRAATETAEVLECFQSGRWHLPDEACLP